MARGGLVAFAQPWQQLECRAQPALRDLPGRAFPRTTRSRRPTCARALLLQWRSDERWKIGLPMGRFHQPTSIPAARINLARRSVSAAIKRRSSSGVPSTTSTLPAARRSRRSVCARMRFSSRCSRTMISPGVSGEYRHHETARSFTYPGLAQPPEHSGCRQRTQTRGLFPLTRTVNHRHVQILHPGQPCCAARSASRCILET